MIPYQSGSKIKKRIVIVLCAVILLAAAIFALSFYTEYLSIKELGDAYLGVFWKNLTVRLASRLISFLLVFAIFFASTTVVQRVCANKGGPFLRQLKKLWFQLVISFLVSLLASAYISETIYDTYLLFLNRTDFGQVDPLFGRDMGYFLFTRPFLAALVNSAISVWLVATIYCFLLYVVIFSVNDQYDLPSLFRDRGAVMHNIVNVVIYFLIKAFTYRFKSEEILYSSINGVAGAGYTDIYVWYNFYKIAPYFLVALVAIALFFLYKAKFKALFVTIAVYPVTIIGVSIAAVLVQSLIVNPNELVKEQPYLEYNLNFTKSAFNIANVIEKEFPVENNLTSEDIEAYSDVLDNVRIADFDASLTAYNSLQGIRNYYKFNDIDVSKYNIDGSPTLVMLAAREINNDDTVQKNQTYTNRVFRYTHGFGAVMSYLNKVTPEGQPEFMIRNIPPVSEENAPVISQPRIYYGESPGDDYVIVNSNIKEIDYLEGSSDKEFSYDGQGGVKLNFLHKLLFSIKNFDFHMLISQYINSDSKILINRNVKQRVEMAIPFLEFDDDPYLIVDDEGRLKWIVDGYTTSTYYPYSQTYDGVNYIRNSVKAVVDAYDGTVDVYVTDPSDPIIQSYQKAYPTAFKDEPLPKSISDHVVYPEYLFSLQAQVYGKYHVNNASTFYNDSDSWVFAKEKYLNEIKDIVPYYNLLQIDEFAENKKDFVIMVPFTLKNKENMTSWLAASCNYNNYGQMVAYQFPKGKNVYGTQQIESRIDNDPAISRELTLWSQGGSTVIRGNTLVVPIKTSLLYIEPVYITSNSGGGIPELKRIVVSYDDKIAMEPTLMQALDVIFNNAPPSGTSDIPPADLPAEPAPQDPDQPPGEAGSDTEDIDLNQVIDSIIDQYNAANAANQNGDWKAFGSAMDGLDAAIRELEQYKNAQDANAQ